MGTPSQTPADTRPPYGARPSAEQKKLIEDLGGSGAVSEILLKRTGFAVTPQAVSLWKARGIPHAYRQDLAAEAEARGVVVPEGFLGLSRSPEGAPS